MDRDRVLAGPSLTHASTGPAPGSGVRDRHGTRRIGVLVAVARWMALFPTLRRRQRLDVGKAAREEPAADIL